MRILLTGASGFIGKELAKELIVKGHELVVITRNPATAKFSFPCEIRDWSSSLKNIDAVFHLAGESIAAKRWSLAQKKKLLESRTQTTKKLIDMARASEGRRPHTFISASAIGFYGDRAEEELTEKSVKGKGFLADVCDEWEREIFHAKQYGMRVVALRVGAVLGRDGGMLAKIIPIFKRYLGCKLGSGKQWISWIHLQDVVSLFIFTLENKEMEGIVNCVGPEPVTNAEFTKMLAKELRVFTVPPSPAFILKIILGEMSALVLDSQKVLPKRAQEFGFTFEYKTFSDAICEIVHSV